MPRSARPVLLRSKLEPPRVFGETLARPRFLTTFAANAISRVTLVHAPAGFGKTTLLREGFLSRDPENAAWLTLDAADNDPGRLLFHLLAALGDAETEHPAETVGLDKIVTSSDQISRLSAVLRQLRDGFCLFLDDLDQLHDPATLGIISRIMKEMPNGCSLVLGGRNYPDLPFGRLRMHGQFLELGAGDLRFTPDEVAQVLRQELPGQRIGKQTLESLYYSTEGWIGSIQMAILSARSSRDMDSVLSSFNGTNTELAEYLAEDLFERQSPDIREFLLASALLDQFSPELCDTILGRDDSAALLQTLARSNMFLSGYEQETDWFRYHNLFRSFLLSRVDSLGADRVKHLRSRAAHWFSEQGRPSTAISYALAAGDMDLAAQLIDASAMDFFAAGRLSTIEHWVRPLPAPLRDQYPQIMLAYAWSLIAQQKQPDTAKTLIDSLERRNDLSRDLRNEIAYLGPFHDALTDRLEGLADHCAAVIAADHEMSAFSKGVLWNIASYARLCAQDYSGAAQTAQAARVEHGKSGSSYGLTYAEGFLSRLELAQGRVESARMHAETVVAVAEEAHTETMARMAAAMLSMRLAFETGRDQDALDLCAPWAGLVEQLAPPYEVLDFFLIQAELAFDGDDYAGACRLLGQLRKTGRTRGNGRIEAAAWAMQAQMAARRGDLGAAQDYLERAGTADRLAHYDGAFVAETRALVEMIGGRQDAARVILDAAIIAARKAGNILALCRLNVLLVELEMQAGNTTATKTTMAEVLVLIRREGLMRPVLRAPDAVRRAFVQYATAQQIDLPAGGLDRLDPSGPARDLPPYRQHLPLEPLSRRELAVLQEMSKGCSNQAIADVLSISLPTVKTHLRNINGKLMAANRTEAAATARRLGLIGTA